MTIEVSHPPVVQIAIDAMFRDAAVSSIEASVEGGADWVEFGRPLIDSLGFEGLRDLTALLRGKYLLLDTMILAAPDRYLKAAAALGARNLTVSALAPEATVASAIRLGRQAGIAITVDLFNTNDPVGKAQRFSDLGADYIMVHFGIDQKRANPKGSPMDLLHEVIAAVSVPVSFATYDIEESLAAVAAGATVIVQGDPIARASAADIAEFVHHVKSS